MTGNQGGKLIGGILLVAGTTIGGGMLALPIAMGFAGVIPALVIFALCWCYFGYTSLLMLEVNLWMGEETNLITMAQKTIGRFGELISWLVYLFLLYALTTAYVAGSASIFVDFIEVIAGVTVPGWLAPFPLVVLFGYFVYRGMRHVDYLNRLFMMGLCVSFFVLIPLLFNHIDVDELLYRDWSYSWVGVSIVVVSFGYHIIIPSLTTYFKGDVSQLLKAIVIGSLFPMVCYVVWTSVALSILPLAGPVSIVSGYVTGENAAALLALLLQQPFIAVVATFLGFFAIVTSFLGVSLSLTDFLADGLHMKASKQGRMMISVLTFLPPLMITLVDPRSFLTALEYAGGFGVITLLGFMPALMVWCGRYRGNFGQGAKFKAPGGKMALLVVMGVALGVFLLEFAIKTHLITLSVGS